MSYKVIRPFKDLSDPKQHDYAVGDAFPREGYDPTDVFTNGLLTGANSAGSIFIAVAEELEKQEVAEVGKVSDTTEDTAEATEDSTLTEDAAEEETSAEDEAEATEEATAEKPKRKRTTKKEEA